MTRTKRYISNAVWSCSSIAVGIVIGFLLSPYIIRKVGDANFGIWALALSLVEYYWLIDLGLRSATIKMSAEFRALGETARLDELLSTGALYGAMAGASLLAATFFAAPHLGSLLNIADPVFPTLVTIVATSWAIGMSVNVLGACLEGFQRFDLFGRIWIVTTGIRSAAIAVVLYLGHGILEMGYILLVTQFLMYAMIYVSFRQVAPDARISWGQATLAMLRRMTSYGVHAFTVLVAYRLLTQSVPLLVAYFMPVRFVAYYAIPMRIMEYFMDGIGRIGMVTTPNATELMATGRNEDLRKLGTYANRYCLLMFLPATVFLGSYGFELFSLWIRPDFAAESAILLPAFLLGYTVTSGQFNSVSILFGIGRHQVYAKFFLGQAILNVIGLAISLPRYGLLGAAWVSAILMVANRGIAVCLITARELKTPARQYAADIYLRPLAVAGLTFVMTETLKQRWLPGNNWSELVLAAALMGIVYASLTLRFCLPGDHREIVWRKFRQAVRLETA